MADRPRISVVIRSYNRGAMLCELIELVLAQEHDSFEVVVVEQSTKVAEDVAARLTALEADPRLRVLRHPPLGGARARNVGVAAARGALVALIDDDDQPVGRGYLAAMEAAMADPKCLGLTCQHVWDDRGPPAAGYLRLARTRVMRFSPWLKLPVAYARYDQPARPVDYVHGTGSILRRSAFERFGGWDEDTPIEDEASFGHRAARLKAPDEYFAFAPVALVRRDLGAAGGLAKRSLTAARFYEKLMTFVHHILGRYMPWRVRLLYPLYVLAGFTWTVTWIWADSRGHDTLNRKVLGVLGFAATLPVHAARVALRPLGRPQPAPRGEVAPVSS